MNSHLKRYLKKKVRCSGILPCIESGKTWLVDFHFGDFLPVAGSFFLLVLLYLVVLRLLLDLLDGPCDVPFCVVVAVVVVVVVLFCVVGIYLEPDF